MTRRPGLAPEWLAAPRELRAIHTRLGWARKRLRGATRALFDVTGVSPSAGADLALLRAPRGLRMSWERRALRVLELEEMRDALRKEIAAASRGGTRGEDAGPC